jgi:hypothetical protein
MNAATKIEPQPTTALALVEVTQGLEPTMAERLRKSFNTMFDNVEKWTAQANMIRVTDESQKSDMKLARVLRLSVKEARVNVEKARKSLKEEALREGKAIDGIANIFKAMVEPLEAHLLEQETFAERKEAERKSALKASREETLRALGTDPSAYANLGETSEETWQLTLEAAQAAKAQRDEDAKQAELVRVEAERIAAEKREAEKKERVRLEAERVERERLQAVENERLRAEKAVVEEQAKADRAERERVEAEAKAEREKADAEVLEARRVASSAERALEVERTRAAAEQKRQEEERAAAAMAPDREKFAAFAAHLRTLGIGSLTTAKGKAAAVKVAEQLEKMAAWVEKTGASL